MIELCLINDYSTSAANKVANYKHLNAYKFRPDTRDRKNDLESHKLWLYDF